MISLPKLSNFYFIKNCTKYILLTGAHKLFRTKQNGEFVSRMYKLNAPLPLSPSGEGYPCFFPPKSGERNGKNAFFLTLLRMGGSTALLCNQKASGGDDVSVVCLTAHVYGLPSPQS
jgi:hypothetical protein